MINPVLFNIYGPLAIHAYGLCIAIGSAIAFYLLSQDKKMQAIASQETLIITLQIALISGFLGGRAIEMLSQPESLSDPLFLFRFWEPGLSSLGAILGVSLALYIYFYFHKIPALKLLDRIAIYAPLVQAFGRIGCFLTGCCYGLPSNGWHSVVYTHPNHLAPLNCALHPSQLYGSILCFGIFLLLYFIIQKRVKKPGMLLFSYLGFISSKRFLIDFIRGDTLHIAGASFLSIFTTHQWLALSITTFSILAIFIISKDKQQT